jgi:hypothetical protein
MAEVRQEEEQVRGFALIGIVEKWIKKRYQGAYIIFL